MDYKEKYEQALERAKDYYKANQKIGESEENEVLSDIFPELVESDDEIIRKAVLNYFTKCWGNCKDDVCGVHVEDAIEWLEKQGKKSSFRERYNRIKNSEWFKKTHEGMSISEEEIKSVDEYEPKFKAGEWIVFNGLVLYIKEVVKGYYRTISRDGIPNSYDWDIDKMARLWSIKEAKDGDVLVFDDIIMIFKNIKTVCTANTHILYCNGIFVDHWCDFGDNAQPATKEQYDFLFTKMKEAGYVWDPEKKELRIVDWSKHIKYVPNGISITEENTDTKIKPKFHVDDWVVQGHNILKIRCVDDKYYCIETVGGYVSYMLISEIDSLYHLWTITDAKDGHVLYSPSHHLIWIYKDNEHYHVCANMNYASDNISMNGSICAPIDTCPAIEDIQNILFRKMKEVGYEWNAKKKRIEKNIIL